MWCINIQDTDVSSLMLKFCVLFSDWPEEFETYEKKRSGGT